MEIYHIYHIISVNRKNMRSVCFVTLFEVKKFLNLLLNYFMQTLFIYKSVTKLRIVEFKCHDLVYMFAKGGNIVHYTSLLWRNNSTSTCN